MLAGTPEAAFCGLDPGKDRKGTRSDGEAFTEDIAPQIVRH